MKQRGRKSSAALAVAIQESYFQRQALPVPAGLTDAERGVWETTVGSKPAEWFGPENVPMLVEYVRHVCAGHVIDAFIKALDEPTLGTDEGLARLDKLTSMRIKNTSMINRLATSMRLTQQSIYQRDKVWNANKGAKAGRALWQDEAKAA